MTSFLTNTTTTASFLIQFVILSILFSGCASTVIIPSSVVKGWTDGQLSYALHLYIGTPPLKVVLEVSFETEDIIIYRDISKFSLSYSNQNGYESDIFYVSDEQHRLHLITDPSRYSPFYSRSNCSTCDGIIGLKKDSVFWKLYPDATFTPVSVTMGGVNPVIVGPVGCNGALVFCSSYKDDSLCTTTGRIGNKNYTVKFSIQSPFTYLPVSLYDEFVQGNNVYESSEDSWKPMHIGIIQRKSRDLEDRSIVNLKSKMINIENCIEDIKITLDPRQMIGKSITGMKVLLIKPNQDTEDNTIVVGSSSWNQFVFYRHFEDDIMIVHNHVVHSNMSITNLLLYSIMLFLLIRWKMTDVNIIIRNNNNDDDDGSFSSNTITSTDTKQSLSHEKVSDRAIANAKQTLKSIVGIKSNQDDRSYRSKRESVMNLFYELSAIPLVSTSFLLQSTRAVMKDFPSIYWTSSVIFLASVVVELWSISLLLFYSYDSKSNIDNNNNNNNNNNKSSNGKSKMSLSLCTHLNITRNITHEMSLITGIWLCMLERRTEGVSTIVTAATNVYGVYNFTFHIIILLVFYFHTKPSFGDRNALIWLFTTIGVPLFYGYYVYITYYYFAYPLMKRNAQLYSQLVVPTLVLSYLMIVNLAAYISSLYIKKGVLRVMSQHNPLDITSKINQDKIIITSEATRRKRKQVNSNNDTTLTEISSVIFEGPITSTQKKT